MYANEKVHVRAAAENNALCNSTGFANPKVRDDRPLFRDDDDVLELSARAKNFPQEWPRLSTLGDIRTPLIVS